MLHKSSRDNARSGRFGTAAGSGRGCWRSPGFNCRLRWPRKQSELAACPQGAATLSPCRCLWVELLEAKPQLAAEGSTGAFGGFPAGLLALGQATVRAALKREPQQGPSPPKCGLGAPSDGCWPAGGHWLSAQPTTPCRTPAPERQTEAISGKARLPPHTHTAAGRCLCSQTLPLPLPQNIPPALAQLPLIWPGLGHTGCSPPVGTACELFPSPHLWLFRSAVARSRPGCFIIEPWECHPESLTPERGAGAAPLNPHRCYNPLIHFNPIMSPCGCFQFWPLKK